MIKITYFILLRFFLFFKIFSIEFRRKISFFKLNGIFVYSVVLSEKEFLPPPGLLALPWKITFAASIWRFLSRKTSFHLIFSKFVLFFVLFSSSVDGGLVRNRLGKRVLLLKRTLVSENLYLLIKLREKVSILVAASGLSSTFCPLFFPHF